MNLRAALTGLEAALVAAGVEASVDPSDLNLPGVWVTLDRIPRDTLTFGGGGLVRVRLFLIVPDRGHHQTVEDLQDLLELVTEVVDPMSDVESTLANVSAGPELPALTFTTDIPSN